MRRSLPRPWAGRSRQSPATTTRCGTGLIRGRWGPDSGGTSRSLACVRRRDEADDEAPPHALPWEGDATQAIPDTTRPDGDHAHCGDGHGPPGGSQGPQRAERVRDRPSRRRWTRGEHARCRGQRPVRDRLGHGHPRRSRDRRVVPVVVRAAHPLLHPRRVQPALLPLEGERAIDDVRDRWARAWAARTASGGAGLVIALSSSSLAVPPVVHELPRERLNIVAPTAQTSLRPSTSSQRPRACSGDMKAGVPIADAGLGGGARRRQLATGARCRSRAP